MSVLWQVSALSAPHADYDKLCQLLLEASDTEIEAASQTGELAHWIPEWARLTGVYNTQHRTHHFPLDVHTLGVLSRTKASTYYVGLTPYQKTLTCLAALLHDIDKNTGPAHLREHIPVDKLHPIKSAEMASRILLRLGAPVDVIQRVYTLIHHHQIFGRLFILYPDSLAPEEMLVKIALKVRSLTVLPCLLALSVGDISAVQKNDAFFTPSVASRLQAYAQQVQGVIERFPAFTELDQASFLSTQSNDNGGCVWAYQNDSKRKNQPSQMRRFLPENIAFYGWLPTGLVKPPDLSMVGFYSLLLENNPFIETLSACDIQALQVLRENQASCRPRLQSDTCYVLGTRPILIEYNQATHQGALKID